MPLYKMSCSCGYSKEYLVRTPDEKVYCPECEEPLTRDISKPSIGSSRTEENQGNSNESCNGESCRIDRVGLGINMETGGLEKVALNYSCGRTLVGDVLGVVDVPSPQTEKICLN